MTFSSYIFILVYLPLSICGYFFMNKVNATSGKLFMVLASWVFYAYAGWKLSIVLGIGIILNLCFSIVICKISKFKRALLSLVVVINIGVLFYYKYFNFFIENISNIGGKDYTLKQIVLPLGISFFTFQQIMYVVDVYRNDIKRVDIIDYLVYILYFPKLIMGPLVAPNELISQFNEQDRKIVNSENISYGIKLFSFGLFKKMVLADTLAKAVAWGYSNIDMSTSLDWIIIMLSYTFEIYFDFSGYSDMAVGVSKCFNIDLPINFDSPYKALSIRDFWKRWHISLTVFFTKYLYIPLGGSRKGKVRTYINILIVFLTSGIWHGANWTFILWGILHGLFNVIDRISEKYKKNILNFIKWICTFIIVNILWLLFRSESIEQWLHLLCKALCLCSLEISDGLIETFVLPESAFLFRFLHLRRLNETIQGFSLLLFIISSFGICLIPNNNYKNQTKNNWITMIMAAIAFVWSFLCLSGESVFIYNNF